MCAQARRNWIKHQAMNWLQKARSPKFLTVTLKHSDAPLRHQLTHLYKSFRALRQRPEFRRTVRGGLWMFEITLNRKENQWHPHIHCLLDADYTPHATLSTLWLDITKTSKIVHIETVSDPSKTAAYLSKYATKPAVLNDYSLEERITIFHVLHGKRLCGTWGSLGGISLTQPTCDDKESWEQVGTWEHITSTLHTDPISRGIWDAFVNDTVLDRWHTPHLRRVLDIIANLPHPPEATDTS